MFYDKEGKKVTLKELYRLQDPFGLGFTVNSDVTPADAHRYSPESNDLKYHYLRSALYQN